MMCRMGTFYHSSLVEAHLHMLSSDLSGDHKRSLQQQCKFALQELSKFSKKFPVANARQLMLLGQNAFLCTHAKQALSLWTRYYHR